MLYDCCSKSSACFVTLKQLFKLFNYKFILNKKLFYKLKKRLSIKSTSLYFQILPKTSSTCIHHYKVVYKVYLVVYGFCKSKMRWQQLVQESFFVQNLLTFYTNSTWKNKVNMIMSQTRYVVCHTNLPWVFQL